MPWGLKRFQQARNLHFITFSCYHRASLLATPAARDTFEHVLERVRQWYGFYVYGYVVMPEHVHLLVSEPERRSLALVLQMLKQIASSEERKFRAVGFVQRTRREHPRPPPKAGGRTGHPSKVVIKNSSILA